MAQTPMCLQNYAYASDRVIDLTENISIGIYVNTPSGRVSGCASGCVQGRVLHATHFPLHCSTLLMSLNLMHPAGWWEGHGGGAGSELHDTI